MERVVLTRTLHFDGPIPLLHSPTKTWARQHFTRTHTHTHTQTRNQCKTLSVTHRSGQPKGQQTAKKALFRIQVLPCMHLTCTTLSTHLSCTCAELAHPRHVTLVLGVLVLDQHPVTTAPTRATCPFLHFFPLMNARQLTRMLCVHSLLFLPHTHACLGSAASSPPFPFLPGLSLSRRPHKLRLAAHHLSLSLSLSLSARAKCSHTLSLSPHTHYSGGCVRAEGRTGMRDRVSILAPQHACRAHAGFLSKYIYTNICLYIYIYIHIYIYTYIHTYRHSCL